MVCVVFKNGGSKGRCGLFSAATPQNKTCLKFRLCAYCFEDILKTLRKGVSAIIHSAECSLPSLTCVQTVRGNAWCFKMRYLSVYASVRFEKKNCATVNYIFLRFFLSYLSHTKFDFSLTILVYNPVRYFVYKWLEKLNLNVKCIQMVRKTEFKPEMYVYLF